MSGRRGALRVVAGTVGGRLLDAPGGTATRPTSARVREAMFNALESLGAVEGARVLDACAGSGALGIEALSRGAAHATFADPDPAAIAAVTANLRGLGLLASSTVVAGPVQRALPSGPYDLVLLDPPYAFAGWQGLLVEVVDHLADGGLVVIESDREVPLPAPLHGVRSRTYGGTVVQFASATGAPT